MSPTNKKIKNNEFLNEVFALIPTTNIKFKKLLRQKRLEISLSVRRERGSNAGMVGDTCVPKLILQEFNSIKKLTPATRDGVGVALDKVSLINERAREIAFLDH